VFRAPDPRTGTRRQPYGNRGQSTRGSRSVATAAGSFLVLLALSVGTYGAALPAVAVLVATMALVLAGFVLVALLVVRIPQIGGSAVGRRRSSPIGAGRSEGLSLPEDDS
jgi:hypothetical protein